MSKVEGFESLWVKGLLADHKYVLLHNNKRNGTHLALFPYTKRENAQTVFVGGKLRVGLNSAYIEGSPNKKVEGSDSTEYLKESYKGFTWQVEEDPRLRTIVGIAIAAGVYDWDRFQDLFVDNGYVDSLLDQIETRAEIAVQNRKIVVAGLNEFYLQGLQKLFHAPPEFAYLHASVLGRSTQLLNQATSGYEATLEKFVSSIAAKQEAAISK